MGILNPLNWIGSLIGLVPGLVSSIGGLLIQAKQTEAAREGAQDANGRDLALSWLTSQNQLNALKAEHQTIQSVLSGLALFAIPTGIHWWFVLLDSVPFYVPLLMDEVHKVGSWHVAAPPGRWADTYFMIIQSYFIGGPAIAGTALLAKAFRRT